MKSSFFKAFLLLAAFMGITDLYGAERQSVRRDFDGDKYNEAEVFYQGGKIQKVHLDTDDDGKAEVMIYYRNGFRDYGLGDLDHDGNFDAWIKYYFTGVPWVIASDTNRDGEPDYWEYLKNGEVYKVQKDRNRDGKVDFEIVIFVDEKRGGRAGKEFAKSRFDNDFDGVFEKMVTGVAEKRPSHLARLLA